MAAFDVLLLFRVVMNSTNATMPTIPSVTHRDQGLGAGPGVAGPEGRSGRTGGRFGGGVLTMEGGS